MKISRQTLQQYFEKTLPSVSEIADAFTFHAFEIESVEGDTLDLKVLPNRAADCKTEEGIAEELSAILDIPLKNESAIGTSTAPAIRVSLSRINGILGSDFSRAQVEDVFRRLRFSMQTENDTFLVTPPSERTDIVISEDIAEEVGRLLGYNLVPAVELPPVPGLVDQARYRGIERMKDQLTEQGFTEVSTQSFSAKGDILLANPLDKTKPALRTSLEANLREALARAKQCAPLVLPPATPMKLFEVGTVFPQTGEYLELRMTERVPEWGDAAGTMDNLTIAKLEEYGKDYAPVRYILGAYKPFAVYPFIIRDIAVWVPSGTGVSIIESIIRENAGELLVRFDQFDHFEKEGKISFAFRLVFQSIERTLTDEEVSAIMQKITAALAAKGYEVR